jgi:hypothetical protein
MSLVLSGTNGLSDVDGSAATPAIRGSDANTGIYFPGADRIGFAEGGVQVGEFDASSNFLFNSGYGSVAVAYGCRAWVNFNGTGTVAIRASGNVSSITDNGTGDYTVNFTTAMPDANYSVTGCAYWAGSDVLVPSLYESGLTARTVNTVRLRNTYVFSGITLYDGAFNSVSIFR